VMTVINYKNPEALVVPVDVIQRTEDQEFLFTAHNNDASQDSSWTVKKALVKTGYRAENRVEVLQGLDKDDYIVVQGYQDLADGEGVSVSQAD